MSAPFPNRDLAVVELRRYVLHPGARETLIELFDREFVETQEAVGMQVLGQFRDLDDPDSFVWLRGFRDMPARAHGLQAFYGGPVWAAHRDAANATMIDTDDVLLLRPVDPPSGIPVADTRDAPPPGMLTITICRPTDPDAFPALFRQEIEPVLRDAGADVVATLATEHSPNNYPALPIREGEDVFVWLTPFADEAAHTAHAQRVDTARLLSDRAKAPPVILRLTPTSRSLLPARRG
jgi:quinol monooxygenase YgiN